jgi:hypothetical protein
MEGRRVENTGELEEPGDYAVDYVEGTKEIAVLWFIMPTGLWGRCANKGHALLKDGEPTEPEWEIAEDDHGKVTVKPSIEVKSHWHGFLKAGIWSTA